MVAENEKQSEGKKESENVIMVDVYSPALKDLYMSTNVKTNVDVLTEVRNGSLLYSPCASPDTKFRPFGVQLRR